MQKQVYLVIILFCIQNLLFGQSKEIPKIKILESNNNVLNLNYEKLILPESIATDEYIQLKKYVKANIKFKADQEPNIFFNLMQWVSNQWDHNGWNAAPDSLTSLDILTSAKTEGVQYRCVEYGKVLHDILLSFGYVARTVGLKSVNVDYGGAGMGHVATEVWSNKLQKWIFLDPQFNIYAAYQKEPLNIYEIYKLKANGKFDKIKFVHPDTSLSQKEDENYANFLKNYLGYVDIAQNLNNTKYNLILKLEGKREYLTFQAFPMSNNIFTTNFKDLYFDLNRTMVLFDYTADEYQRVQKIYSKLKIQTEEDFNKNMHLFAARPQFKLTFLNNMPWFKEYIVYLNGNLLLKEKSEYIVSLNKGKNTLEIIPVNTAGVEGVPTKIIIEYGF